MAATVTVASNVASNHECMPQPSTEPALLAASLGRGLTGVSPSYLSPSLRQKERQVPHPQL